MPGSPAASPVPVPGGRDEILDLSIERPSCVARLIYGLVFANTDELCPGRKALRTRLEVIEFFHGKNQVVSCGNSQQPH
jgi:hypothetical protein